MDESKTRSHIQAHADAVVRGDMDTVVGDFIEEMRPQVPQLATVLPQPVTEAEVLSCDVGEDETVAKIRYAGDSSEVTIHSQWREGVEHPEIFHAEPAS